MKTLIKILLGLIAILVVLIIAAVIILPQVIDPNDYKEQISTLVKEKTGRTLSIEGDITLSVFPWLGVSTGKLTLSQPAGIDAKPLVAVDRADIKVKLLSLLSDHKEVDTIVLEKPAIHWVVVNDQLNSLTGLSHTTEKPDVQTEPGPQNNEPAPTDTASETRALHSFSLHGVDISGGVLSYDDRRSQQRYTLSDFTLSAGDILNNEFTAVRASGVIDDGNESFTFAFDTNAQVDLDTTQARANTTTLTLSDKTNARTLTAQMADLAYLNNAVEVNDIRIKAELDSKDINVTLPTANIALNEHRATLGDAEISAEGLTATFSKPVIKDWHNTLTYQTQLDTNVFSAQQLLRAWGVDYRPSQPQVLTKVQTSALVSGSANGIALQNIELTVDDTNATGNISVTEFAQPQTRFDLAIDAFNVDRYLPASSDATQKNEQAAQAVVVPLAGFKVLNANGTLQIGQLVVNNIKMNTINVDVASKNSTLSIKPTARLYDGRMVGDIQFTEGKTKTLTFDTSLTDVNLEPLLTDAGATNQLQGKGKLTTDITIQETGDNQTKKGSIRLVVKDGLIKGFDIKKILEDTQRRYDELRGKAVKPQASLAEDTTRFSEMSATLKLNNDTLTNNDLLLKAPAIRVGGEGRVNIDKQTIDYLTNVSVVKTNDGQGGDALEALEGVTIPIRFTGAITNPDYAVDIKALIKANAQDKVDAEKDRALKKLGKKLGLETDNDSDDQQKALEKAAKEKAKKELSRGLENLLQ